LGLVLLGSCEPGGGADPHAGRPAFGDDSRSTICPHTALSHMRGVLIKGLAIYGRAHVAQVCNKPNRIAPKYITITKA
jgi:hypothetical protein